METEDGMIYTTKEYIITVTLTDNKDGTITAEADMDLEDVLFENKYEPKTTFTVTKIWEGGDGELIQLVLYADGVRMEPQPPVFRDGDTYTFKDLPKYRANGREIVYSAKEIYMTGYMTIYKNIGAYKGRTDYVFDGGTIVNRAVIEFYVTKVWTGLKDGETPPAIELILYRNGEVYDKKPTKVGDQYWWYNLPKDGEYVVVEKTPAGYTTIYRNNGGHADVTDRAYPFGTIENHRIPDTGDDRPVETWIAMTAAGITLMGAALLIIRRRRNAVK